jgi:hypothetical protein
MAMRQAFLPSMIRISTSIRGSRPKTAKGTILRFIDLGGEPRTVTIHTPLLSISKIVATGAIERDQKPIVPEDVHTFKMAVPAHQILPVRLILQYKH